jgi:threonine dehydratase
VTSPAKAERIRSYGANLVVAGERYADALAASEPLRANDHETSESEEFNLGA